MYCGSELCKHGTLNWILSSLAGLGANSGDDQAPWQHILAISGQPDTRGAPQFSSSWACPRQLLRQSFQSSICGELRPRSVLLVARINVFRVQQEWANFLLYELLLQQLDGRQTKSGRAPPQQRVPNPLPGSWNNWVCRLSGRHEPKTGVVLTLASPLEPNACDTRQSASLRRLPQLERQTRMSTRRRLLPAWRGGK